MSHITPMVPVSDILISVAFFGRVPGFEVGLQMDGYAFLRRDSIAIRLVNAESGVDTHDRKRQLSCFINVEGIDALFEELKPELDKLPQGRVRAPFNQAYGQREFHVIDEDSILIFFGEPVDPAVS